MDKSIFDVNTITCITMGVAKFPTLCFRNIVVFKRSWNMRPSVVLVENYCFMSKRECPFVRFNLMSCYQQHSPLVVWPGFRNSIYHALLISPVHMAFVWLLKILRALLVFDKNSLWFMLPVPHHQTFWSTQHYIFPIPSWHMRSTRVPNFIYPL